MVKKNSAKVTPANRRKTGVNKLRGGLDPSVGEATRFKPGESGNPTGRPKLSISDAYRVLADQKVPLDPKGRTYAELLAEGQFRSAIKGKTDAAKEIADRIEGKAKQEIAVGGTDTPLEFNLNIKFVDPDDNQPA